MTNNAKLKFCTMMVCGAAVALWLLLSGVFNECGPLTWSRFGFPMCTFREESSRVADAMVELSEEWPRDLALLCDRSCLACAVAVSNGVRRSLWSIDGCVSFESLETMRSELHQIHHRSGCGSTRIQFYLDQLDLLLWVPVDVSRARNPLLVQLTGIGAAPDAWAVSRSGQIPAYGAECRAGSEVQWTDVGYRTSYFNARRCYSPYSNGLFLCADLIAYSVDPATRQDLHPSCTFDGYLVETLRQHLPVW
jgi:hypothetical protein